MKQAILAFMVLFAAVLACAPAPVLTDAKATVTTFVDESGNGQMPESYSPLSDTLVIATWNQHGHLNREVRFTDSNGRADFSVSYTHFFDVSVFPPCGYYSTTPLHRNLKRTEKADFGFWQATPSSGLATVKVLLWQDLNANGTRDPQEEITGQEVSVMFKIPNGTNGNPFDQDNFVKDSADGWFNIPLGNSCGTIYLLLLNTSAATQSVSEPGKDSDAGARGSTLYPAIEIPYGAGETTVYWEIR